MNGMDLRENHVRPVLACLGVASRFRLVRALAGADRCVGELAEAVGLSQSCTTRHLQALERVGLVRGRREGRRVRFSLRAEAPGLGELLGWALSGVGLEALVAGGNLHRDQATADPARSLARSLPPSAPRRARPPGRSRPPDDVARVPLTAPESSRVAGPQENEQEGHAGVGSSVPAQRPGDLEDYLL
jgi:DNA-binding transcriptional ArsR family regulator